MKPLKKLRSSQFPTNPWIKSASRGLPLSQREGLGCSRAVGSTGGSPRDSPSQGLCRSSWISAGSSHGPTQEELLGQLLRPPTASALSQLSLPHGNTVPKPRELKFPVPPALNPPHPHPTPTSLPHHVSCGSSSLAPQHSQGFSHPTPPLTCVPGFPPPAAPMCFQPQNSKPLCTNTHENPVLDWHKSPPGKGLFQQSC